MLKKQSVNKCDILGLFLCVSGALVIISGIFKKAFRYFDIIVLKNRKFMKILVSSLEPSANLHLGYILKNLENYELKGIFDPKFGKPLLASSEFSAMGFVEVLPLIFKAKEL